MILGIRPFLPTLFVFIATGNLPAIVVESVDVRGTQRELFLETKAGVQLDERVVSRDVHRLWQTGRFDDIRVESSTEDDRVRLVFQVTERPRFLLREVKFEPHGEHRELTVKKGTPLTGLSAREAASSLEKQLVTEGFSEASVEARLVPIGGGEADLEVDVARGPKVRVAEVELEGELGMDEKRLRQSLRETAARRWLPGVPGIWKGWVKKAPYTADRVESDLAAMRSLYLSEGYLMATVGLREALVDDSRATIRIHADSGPRFQIDGTRVEATDGNILLREFSPGLPVKQLCKCLFAERRKAEKEGRIDFSVRFEWERLLPSSSQGQSAVENPLAKVVMRLDPDPAYRVGRIEFHGNNRLRDTTLRRALVIDEGDAFDPRAMRVSLARLNRFSMLEPMSESDVVAHPAGDNTYDLTISVREQKHGRWAISGPLGPLSLFGPLRFSIDSRLPPWGRGVLDLSTWLISAGVFSYVDPVVSIVSGDSKSFWRPFVALHRPVLPGQEWTSGFLVSPWVGWKQSLLYTGLVQAQSRATGLLAGDGNALMPLTASVWQRSEDNVTAPAPGVFLCRPEKSRWDWLRAGAKLALGLASGVL